MIVLVLLLTPSCSLFRSLEEPEVSLADVRLEKMTFFETALITELRLINENQFPLEIEGGSIELYLNESYIGKGLITEGFTVPRFSSETARVRVIVDNLSLATRLSSMLSRDELAYSLRSTLHLHAPFGARRVRVKKSGTIALPSQRGDVRSNQPEYSAPAMR